MKIARDTTEIHITQTLIHCKIAAYIYIHSQLFTIIGHFMQKKIEYVNEHLPSDKYLSFSFFSILGFIEIFKIFFVFAKNLDQKYVPLKRFLIMRVK